MRVPMSTGSVGDAGALAEPPWYVWGGNRRGPRQLATAGYGRGPHRNPLGIVGGRWHGWAPRAHKVDRQAQLVRENGGSGTMSCRERLYTATLTELVGIERDPGASAHARACGRAHHSRARLGRQFAASPTDRAETGAKKQRQQRAAHAQTVMHSHTNKQR